MPDSHPPGARLIFRRGNAELAPPAPVPDGYSPALASVISPGTELRHLASTVTGPARAAGYMTLARAVDGGFLLAPVPHGSPVQLAGTRALRAPPGTAIEHIAVARFQLMAAIGMSRWGTLARNASRVLVVGSGPVAVGCVLELCRLGVTRITVATRHPSPALARLPEVTVTAEVAPAAERTVIDCTGRAGQSLIAVAPGGILGLLGTPPDDAALPAAVVHRTGAAVAGMHELADHDPAASQELFTAVLADVTARVGPEMARSWCRIAPGAQAARLYQELCGPHRPAEPFLLLDWSS